MLSAITTNVFKMRAYSTLQMAHLYSLQMLTLLLDVLIKVIRCNWLVLPDFLG